MRSLVPNEANFIPALDEVLDHDRARRDLDHDAEGNLLDIHTPAAHHLFSRMNWSGWETIGNMMPRLLVPLFPEPLERLDLEPELVRALEIAADAPPAEHRVVLVRLVLAALHVPELVGRGIEGPHPDGLSRERVEHDLDAVVEFPDELLLLLFVMNQPGVLLSPRIRCSIRRRPTPSAPVAAARAAASGMETFTLTLVAVMIGAWPITACCGSCCL